MTLHQEVVGFLNGAVKVFVRSLTGAQRDWLEASMFTGKGGNREANMQEFPSQDCLPFGQ